MRFDSINLQLASVGTVLFAVGAIAYGPLEPREFDHSFAAASALALGLFVSLFTIFSSSAAIAMGKGRVFLNLIAALIPIGVCACFYRLYVLPLL